MKLHDLDSMPSAFCKQRRTKPEFTLNENVRVVYFKPCDSEIVAGSLSFTVPGFLLLLTASSDTPTYFQNRIHQ